MTACTVTFIGHGNYDFSREAEIESTVLELISQGYNRFLFGGMGNYDHSCARIVRGLKETHPHICLCLVRPACEIFLREEHLYDETICHVPEEELPSNRIVYMRNLFMIENAAAAICYIRKFRGGACRACQYALENGVKLYGV